MISSILVSNKNLKELQSGLIISIFGSIFCFIFYLIYNIFSHGVHSPFMTYLFVWPLLLEVLPALLCLMIRALPGPSILSSLFWNTGCALASVSSLLRGILDIAGTASAHQKYMMITGFVFLAAGLIFYAVGIFQRHFSKKI